MFDYMMAAIDCSQDECCLSCFCDMAPASLPAFPADELTEEQLQALEEKADNWYLCIADVL